jgi:hypothetical protein
VAPGDGTVGDFETALNSKYKLTGLNAFSIECGQWIHNLS